MYRIYIGNIEVSENNIDGFDSIKIKKNLSPVYWGYWNEDGFGLSDSNSNAKVTITDRLAVSFIKKEFEKNGYAAKVPVVILNQSTGQRVELLIDYSEYAEPNCCDIECAFMPKGGGLLLKSREKIEYPIQLTETIQVPIRPVPLNVQFKVQSDTYDSTIGIFNHYAPVTVSENSYSNGTSSQVNIGESKPFLKVFSSDCVQVIGSVKINISSGISAEFKAILMVNSTETLIDTFPITTELTEQTITINTSLDLKDGDELSLKLVTEDVINDFQVVYDDSSVGITVQKCINKEIEWRNVKAVSVRNAFKKIIQSATNSTNSIGTYLFDDCLFDGYLTNNEGLQNKISSITVSFSKLFEELNNKYPSSVDVNGTINIMARCEFINKQNPTKVQAVDITRTINQDLLYSDVKIGYNNWKPDNIFGSMEHNSTRVFQSDYTTSSKSLSLLNDWSSSSLLISEQILKEKQKEEIHWIVVNKQTLKAETNEFISSNIYLADRAINMRITPTRNLERWKYFMLNNLDFASGTGNYTFESTDTYNCGCMESTGKIDETMSLEVMPIIGKFVYNFSVDSCSINLSALKGCIAFEYCGKTKLGLVSSVEYSISQVSNEEIKVEVIEL